MRYVEFCAGAGGTRSGLNEAGWRCAAAIDNDVDAVSVHHKAHGSILNKDILKLEPQDIPSAEVWVAGFPCQPFSSSGSRSGFDHKSGNIFERLVYLAESCQPKVIFLENVVGLLSNKEGHTFASILQYLTKLQYFVDWCVLDLQCFGVPQSRPRLFAVAVERNATTQDRLLQCVETKGISYLDSSIFSRPLSTFGVQSTVRNSGSLTDIVEKLRPAIGKAKRKGPSLFGKAGYALGDRFVTCNLTVPTITHSKIDLGPKVAPNFSLPDLIRSIRFWSPQGGGGESGIHVRDSPISHCVGTSLGGAPLFSVPINAIKDADQRSSFLEFSNWHREQDELLVMRLCPEQAVFLFGPYTEGIHQAFVDFDVGATRKYKLVGNLVAPIVAKTISELIDTEIARSLVS